MITNYIPISRKLFEHPFWHEDRTFSKFEAWLDILQAAQYKPTKYLIGTKLVEVKRGQLAASLRYLAVRWGWSRHKVDIFLNCLIQDQMIEKGTAEGTGQTLITICNYDAYNYKTEKAGQQKGQQRDSSVTLTGQQRDKYNKVKKENNEKKEKNNTARTSPFIPPTLEQVKHYCLQRCNHVNPTRFHDFYQSKGWLVGRNPMKDWRACVRTWEQRTPSPPQQSLPHSAARYQQTPNTPGDQRF